MGHVQETLGELDLVCKLLTLSRIDHSRLDRACMMHCQFEPSGQENESLSRACTQRCNLGGRTGIHAPRYIRRACAWLRMKLNDIRHAVLPPRKSDRPDDY
ncbi:MULTISPECIES: hypothetical protein [Bradyrhizobium]|uniref:hypothetical protein n=1 Tax=Bradyrhizobium TaxID=374 RepID=UPI001B8A2E3E|nr:MULTISPECIES: hypothetical protein [Bradyrhizobium]MBR0969374.1 hypothetical protein [Bradyrhizobium japonicum]